MGHEAAAQASTTAVIDRFNDAFQRHDPSGLPALIAEHCVLENTVPAPDGERRVGRAACLELRQSIAANRAGRFELEPVEVQRELFEALLAYPEVPPRWRETDLAAAPALMLPCELTHLGAGRNARMFSTVTTLSTPQDVTLQDLHIEAFYPADAETAALTFYQ